VLDEEMEEDRKAAAVVLMMKPYLAVFHGRFSLVL
jgi:hypothetical protein